MLLYQMMITLLPAGLKNARDRLQHFESEVPDIAPNDFDGEHPVFAEKNNQVIDSLNNTYGLLSDPTVRADDLALLSRPAKTDRHQSDRWTTLDTYNPKAGTDPNDMVPGLAQNQSFSQPQTQSLDGTDASGSNYENWTSTSVPLSRQTYEYIEAQPRNVIQSQPGLNWGNTSTTVTDDTFPSGITDDKMAELFGFADIDFNQNEGSFSFIDLL
jgi:hypothetical protein